MNSPATRLETQAQDDTARTTHTSLACAEGQVRCAWCGVALAPMVELLARESSQPLHQRGGHGICGPCTERMMAEVMQMPEKAA